MRERQWQHGCYHLYWCCTILGDDSVSHSHMCIIFTPNQLYCATTIYIFGMRHSHQRLKDDIVMSNGPMAFSHRYSSSSWWLIIPLNSACFWIIFDSSDAMQILMLISIIFSSNAMASFLKFAFHAGLGHIKAKCGCRATEKRLSCGHKFHGTDILLRITPVLCIL